MSEEKNGGMKNVWKAKSYYKKKVIKFSISMPFLQRFVDGNPENLLEKIKKIRKTDKSRD